jgi:hypothetical protein
MLVGILVVCALVVIAGGAGSQHASAQQAQYAPPGNGDSDGADGSLPSDGGTGSPSDGDGDGISGDDKECSGGVESVEATFDEWATSNLTPANIAFNTPKEMQLGETKSIELLLSPEMLFGELAQQVMEPGEIVCVHIVAGDITQARLEGSNFRIEPLTPETQTISPEGITKWKWDIEPIHPGEAQKLHLTISAFVKTPQGTRPHAIETFDHTVTVNVTLGQRVANFFNLGSTPFLSLIPLLTVAGGIGTWLGTRLQRWRTNRRERTAGATRINPSPESRRHPPPHNGL